MQSAVFISRLFQSLSSCLQQPTFITNQDNHSPSSQTTTSKHLATMAEPLITHAPKMFKGFDLTKIEDLRLLHEGLERKFVKIERYPDESDLKPEQIESLDKLWDCISGKSEDAELAKEFMRMIIAAPTLVTEENRKSMTRRDLGLTIVGAALHRGGLGEESPIGKSTKALVTSVRSEVGCGDGRGKTYIGGGRGNPGSTEEVSTSHIFHLCTSLTDKVHVGRCNNIRSNWSFHQGILRLSTTYEKAQQKTTKAAIYPCTCQVQGIYHFNLIETQSQQERPHSQILQIPPRIFRFRGLPFHRQHKQQREESSPKTPPNISQPNPTQNQQTTTTTTPTSRSTRR